MRITEQGGRSKRENDFQRLPDAPKMSRFVPSVPVRPKRAHAFPGI
jgi:hypothetical protein